MFSLRYYVTIASMAAKTRAVTLDVPLQDERVENASYVSTRTLLEHEIALWNPARILDHYAISSSYRGLPTLSDDGTAKFLRDSERRRREMRDFLGLGRLLVVLIPSPKSFYVATGQTENEGTAAKPRLKRIVIDYSIQELIPGDPKLTEASGTSFGTVGGGAFPAFWKAVRDQFSYAAHIDFDGTPLLLVKGTTRVIAGLASVEGGTVLFLPERYSFGPDDDFAEATEGKTNEDELWDQEQRRIDREMDGALLDALFDFAAEIRGSPDEGLPAWSERFALPGEEAAARGAESAAGRAEKAHAIAEQAKVDLLALQQRKRLITATGNELELAVEEALVALGCSVEPGEPGRTDRIVSWKKHQAVIEVKGVGKSAREKDAAQLEKWVSEQTIETGKVPKAILLVNAWRKIPIDARDQPAFPPQMRPYAEGRGQCLVSTSQLLTAVVTATSQKKKSEFLTAMFETDGVLDGWDWKDAFPTITPGEAKEA